MTAGFFSNHGMVLCEEITTDSWISGLKQIPTIRLVHPNLKYSQWKNWPTLPEPNGLLHEERRWLTLLIHCFKDFPHFFSQPLYVVIIFRVSSNSRFCRLLIKHVKHANITMTDKHGTQSSVTSSKSMMQKMSFSPHKLVRASHSICFNKEITCPVWLAWRQVTWMKENIDESTMEIHHLQFQYDLIQPLLNMTESYCPSSIFVCVPHSLECSLTPLINRCICRRQANQFQSPNHHVISVPQGHLLGPLVSDSRQCQVRLDFQSKILTRMNRKSMVLFNNSVSTHSKQSFTSISQGGYLKQQHLRMHVTHLHQQVHLLLLHFPTPVNGQPLTEPASSRSTLFFFLLWPSSSWMW